MRGNLKVIYHKVFIPFVGFPRPLANKTIFQ